MAHLPLRIDKSVQLGVFHCCVRDVRSRDLIGQNLIPLHEVGGRWRLEQYRVI